MDVGSIISSVLSLLAIGVTARVYYKHDKRLKEQDAKINDYQLKKIEAEEAENKQAKVRANLIKGDKGKRTLKVFNSGKSVAKNIYVEFIDDSHKGVIIGSFPKPFELLNTHDNFEISINTYIGGSSGLLKVKLTWEDDFSNDNEYVQHFKL